MLYYTAMQTPNGDRPQIIASSCDTRPRPNKSDDSGDRDKPKLTQPSQLTQSSQSLQQLNRSLDPIVTDIAIVLCQAEQAGNVGAICRAMDSMGFSRLILVQCPDYDPDIVKMYALRSYWIYEQAERYANLQEALAQRTYAAGFTRRTGAHRLKATSINDWAEQHRAFLEQAKQPSRLALVFGNEKHGLTSEELAFCDEGVNIPTSLSQPSLNLAQAVQLALWECRRAVLVHTTPHHGTDAQIPSRAQLERRIMSFLDLLDPLHIYKKHNKTEIAALMRSVFARANLSELEFERMFGFLEQIIHITRQKGKK